MDLCLSYESSPSVTSIRLTLSEIIFEFRLLMPLDFTSSLPKPNHLNLSSLLIWNKLPLSVLMFCFFCQLYCTPFFQICQSFYLYFLNIYFRFLNIQSFQTNQTASFCYFKVKLSKINRSNFGFAFSYCSWLFIVHATDKAPSLRQIRRDIFSASS